MQRELAKVINRMASAGWQASGCPVVPVDVTKWRTIAQAMYEELMNIDKERQK